MNSTLIAFVSFFDLVNPWLTSAWSIKLEMGAWAVIAAHVLFNIAVVALLVRARLQGMDRSLVEASLGNEQHQPDRHQQQQNDRRCSHRDTHCARALLQPVRGPDAARDGRWDAETARLGQPAAGIGSRGGRTAHLSGRQGHAL